MSLVVTRFAPSPTGLLHLGHAYAAMVAHDLAMAAGGRFLLRLEDIDGTRCEDRFRQAIFEDLRWLGLRFEEPVRQQSAHMADYQSALDRLQDMGVIYPCFCTRADIAREIAAIGHAPHAGEALRYPGTCRKLDEGTRAARIREGRPYGLRLDVARAREIVAAPLTFRDDRRGEVMATPELLGDVVLARKDTPTSYHLAVTVDDALQGITLVTRGDDLFEATHIHRLLQALLGFPTPRYHHHVLLVDEHGKRFAKRNQAVTIRACRESGMTAADIRDRVMAMATARLTMARGAGA